MKTALLLTNSTDSQQLFTRLLGDQTNLILLAPPEEPSREKFDALFATWLRLVDGVVLDAVALGEITRWAVESLRAARLAEHQSVVVRATDAQAGLHPVNGDWLVVRDTDPQDQMERSLRTFLDLRAAQAQLKRADALIERQRLAAATPAGSLAAAPNAESLRYRDALKNFAHVLGQHPDENALLIEFLRVVRELLGVGKLAIFSRCFQNDLFTEQLTLHGNQLAIVGSSGIAPNVVEHFRLNVDFGLAGQLARTAQVLRRTQMLDPLTVEHDPQVVREFEALGTEFAVPMFDNDQLLGVLTFSGKITGDPLANEELELVYHLLNQLAQVIRNLHLQAKVAGQQLFTGEVLANIQSGVLVVGQDNRVLSANRQARTILELGDEDFVGQDLNRLPPCVGDTLYSVLQTGQPAHAVEQVLPGSRRPLRLHATRFTTSLTGGSDQMVVALVEDLTQTKIQEAQARELADREFFTRLAARLSHELKNALVSVKIYAQLLPERKNDPEFREEFSRTVVNEVNRVDALVNNLTFFSHPLGLVHENLDLAAVLDTTLKTVTNECGRQQKLQVVLFGEKATETPGLPTVTVKRTYQHKPARIAADRIRLIQAFEHVLRNAFQALDQGGRLSISTADAAPTDYSDGQLPPGGAVKIEVLDTGEGIALEKIAHVTEPFVTTRNIGVGLGLTIVKKIVERHSGRLIIDSLLGKGTTVTVLLPVKAQPHPEDDLAQPASANHHDGGAVAPTPTRIHAETPHPVH